MKTTIESIREYCNKRKEEEIGNVICKWESFFSSKKESLEKSQRIVDIIRTDKEISDYIRRRTLENSNYSEVVLYSTASKQIVKTHENGENERIKEEDSGTNFLSKYRPRRNFEDLEFVKLVNDLPLTERGDSEKQQKFFDIFFFFDDLFMLLHIEERAEKGYEENRGARTKSYYYEEIFEVKVKRLDYYVL